MNLAEWSHTDERRQRELVIKWYKEHKWHLYENLAFRAAQSLKRKLAAIPKVTNVKLGGGQVIHIHEKYMHIHELELNVCTLFPETARLEDLPTRHAGFRVAQLNLGDKRKAFLKTWKRLFKELKGWDEKKTLRWAKQWADSLSGQRPSEIYHYGPVKIAVSSLVDAQFKASVGPKLYKVYAELISIIEKTENSESPRITHPDSVLNYDWDYARRHMNQVIHKYRTK